MISISSHGFNDDSPNILRMSSPLLDDESCLIETSLYLLLVSLFIRCIWKYQLWEGSHGPFVSGFLIKIDGRVTAAEC